VKTLLFHFDHFDLGFNENARELLWWHSISRLLLHRLLKYPKILLRRDEKMNEMTEELRTAQIKAVEYKGIYTYTNNIYLNWIR